MTGTKRAGGSPYSEEFKDKVVKFYQENGITKTARRFKLARSTVSRWIQELDISERYNKNYPNHYSLKFREEVLEYYKEHGLTETARVYNLTPNAINVWSRTIPHSEKKFSHPNAYPPELKAEVVEYYKKHGPSAASREFGITASLVDSWAKKAGARTEVAEGNRRATEAMTEKMRLRRANIASGLLDDAERLRRQIWEPHQYHDWGGKDHEFDVREVEQIPPADKLKLMQATSTALDQASKLMQETDSSKSDADSMLSRLSELVKNDE